ncbi:MAG: hypothetical protein IPJ65_06000 [Archangiaceae bacterium]|nr:hypothetical protein [Archangiaceae bacterium]
MRRLLVTLAAVAAACGPVDFSTYVPPDNGKLCYDDADCAPNGCCGMGTAIVHKDDAPDCSAASCTGSCPVNGIKCGCAVPLCRNSRCVAAISPTPDC